MNIYAYYKIYLKSEVKFKILIETCEILPCSLNMRRYQLKSSGKLRNKLHSKLK